MYHTREQDFIHSSLCKLINLVVETPSLISFPSLSHFMSRNKTPEVLMSHVRMMFCFRFAVSSGFTALTQFLIQYWQHLSVLSPTNSSFLPANRKCRHYVQYSTNINVMFFCQMAFLLSNLWPKNFQYLV